MLPAGLLGRPPDPSQLLPPGMAVLCLQGHGAAVGSGFHLSLCSGARHALSLPLSPLAPQQSRAGGVTTLALQIKNLGGTQLTELNWDLDFASWVEPNLFC